MRTRILTIFFLILLAGGGFVVWGILSQNTGETRLGFIENVTTNGNYGIVFDEAEWLTGREGEDAAIEAGLCTEVTRYTCLPNDYIIRNASRATQNLEFGTDVTITMMTLTMERGGVKEMPVSREEFERLINDPRAEWRNLPYEITVRSGLVQEVKEIYVP